MPPRKTPKPAPVADAPVTRELRAALRSLVESGRSARAIAAEAEVDPAAVRRFLSGERSLHGDSIDRLAKLAGCKLVRPARSRKTT